MADYVGAIDQGTTSTRFMIFDHGGNVVGFDQKEHEQIYPEARLGRARPEGDLEAHAGGDRRARCRRPASQASDLAAVGITNQRETTVVWDRKTGKPVYNAIVWQDTRTDRHRQRVSADGGQDRFRDKTGLPLATYFSGTEGQVDPRQRRRRARQGRGRRPAVRQHRHLGDLEPHRRDRTAASTSPTSRTPAARC